MKTLIEKQQETIFEYIMDRTTLCNMLLIISVIVLIILINNTQEQKYLDPSVLVPVYYTDGKDTLTSITEFGVFLQIINKEKYIQYNKNEIDDFCKKISTNSVFLVSDSIFHVLKMIDKNWDIHTINNLKCQYAMIIKELLKKDKIYFWKLGDRIWIDFMVDYTQAYADPLELYFILSFCFNQNIYFYQNYDGELNGFLYASNPYIDIKEFNKYFYTYF